MNALPGDIILFTLVTYEGKEVKKQGAVTNMESSCGGRIVLDGDGILRQVASTEIVEVLRAATSAPWERQGNIRRVAADSFTTENGKSPDIRIFTDKDEAKDHRTYLSKVLVENELHHGEYYSFTDLGTPWVVASLYNKDETFWVYVEIAKR